MTSLAILLEDDTKTTTINASSFAVHAEVAISSTSSSSVAKKLRKKKHGAVGGPRRLKVMSCIEAIDDDDDDYNDLEDRKLLPKSADATPTTARSGIAWPPPSLHNSSDENDSEKDREKKETSNGRRRATSSFTNDNNQKKGGDSGVDVANKNKLGAPSTGLPAMPPSSDILAAFNKMQHKKRQSKE